MMTETLILREIKSIPRNKTTQAFSLKFVGENGLTIKVNVPPGQAFDFALGEQYRLDIAEVPEVQTAPAAA